MSQMARSHSISVVIPCPSLHVRPLKAFDEDLFDRTIDDILSEEASRESSLDEYEAMNASSSPSRFDDNDLHDALALSSRRARGIKTKSPRFPTPSTTPVTTNVPVSDVETLKSNASSKNKNTIATMGLCKDAQNVSKKVSRKSKKKAKKESKQNSSEDSTDGMSLDKTPQGPKQLPGQLPAKEAEESPEDKIFASVSDDKRMGVLQFIASHTFMTTQAEGQPILRSARRQFTDQVRDVAFAAGMDNPSVDALLELVRKTYLDERSIIMDDAGSTFGDEIDDEKQPLKRSHKKQSSLSHIQTMVSKGFLNDSKQRNVDSKQKDCSSIVDLRKHKRRHSDSAARHDPSKPASGLDFSGAQENAETTGARKRKRRHSENATQHTHDEAAVEDQHSKTTTITPESTLATNHVEITSTEDVPEKTQSKKRKRRHSVSASQHSHDKGGIKFGGSGEDNSRSEPSLNTAPFPLNHPVAVPPSELAKSKAERRKVENRKKLLRKKKRKLGKSLALSEHQPDIHAEHPAQQMNTPTRQSSSRQSSKEARSPHPPLPTDANLWDVDF
jgi:hypothetical protein